MAFDFEKEIKDRKLIFGEKMSLKQANKGLVEAIFISSDCRNAARIIADAKNTEIKQISLTSAQMRETCKKPFCVSVVSLVKEAGKSRKKEKAEEGEDAEEEKPKKGAKKRAKKKKEDQ